jgi:hypothetical protein
MMHPSRRIAKRMRLVAEDVAVDQEEIAAVDVDVVEAGDGVASKAHSSCKCYEMCTLL